MTGSSYNGIFILLNKQSRLKLMLSEKSVLKNNARSENVDRLSKVAIDLLNETKMPKEIGVGIELEFFLRDKSEKKLCDIHHSQAFLKELSGINGWSVFSTNHQSDKVLRVSKELSGNRYHTVKYEHPPHMMEVALSYSKNLVDLRANLMGLRADLELAAYRSGVEIDISLKVEKPTISWDDINQIENRFQALSQSRKRVFELHAVDLPDHRLDFTMFTAATQFHIGGVRWWNESPVFVDRLYRAEFLISGMAYSRDEAKFHDRWSSYRYVFSDMPLLGFPNLKKWDTSKWIEGLLQSPYFNGDSNTFEDVVNTLDNEQLKKELLLVRDLQIVKPKWIGTLEYRSDPAIDNINTIMQLAAMRLGAYISAMRPHGPTILSKISFEDLSSQWWGGKHVSNFQDELSSLQEISFEALKTRGCGEEGLL